MVPESSVVVDVAGPSVGSGATREAARLHALRGYEILDTPAEWEYDEITRLAAQICGTPIALISLVDESRQWFKSRVGMETTQTPRDIAFCNVGIQNKGFLVVNDAHHDPRFNRSPLVTGDPYIRFYAGAPLTTPEGHNVGMLCVNDRVPREISEEKLDSLRLLANLVVRQMELRRKLAGVQELATNLAATSADSEAARATLSAVFEAAEDGLLAVDLAGRITQLNKTFIDMWRIPAAILENKDNEAALTYAGEQLRDPKAFSARVRELLNDPTSESFDELEFKDGRVFERYSRPLRLGDRTIGRVWSFRDVTQRRLAEQERLRALRQEKELQRLREMDTFKTQLINNASHELNTPISAIRLQLHLLELEAADQPSSRLRLAIPVLVRNVERLTTLVRDTLDVARLQGGKLSLHVTRFSLNELVDEAMSTFAPLAAQQNQHLRANLEPGLRLDGDQARVSQILYNLLSNALKFTPAGGSIQISGGVAQGRLRLTVMDSGIGMSAAQIEKLFQPFSRVHDEEALTIKGTGLGLYICKAIVERHNGRLWCESEGPGHGCAFVMDLPAAG